MASAVANRKRAEGASQPPSPDPPTVTPDAADEADGVDLELACTLCGCIVWWHVAGDPFPSCPRCDDATRGEV
jgi:hypothetical protein